MEIRAYERCPEKIRRCDVCEREFLDASECIQDLAKDALPICIATGGIVRSREAARILDCEPDLCSLRDIG